MNPLSRTATMVAPSSASDPSPIQSKDLDQGIVSTVTKLKNEVQSSRLISIKERIEENKKNSIDKRGRVIKESLQTKNLLDDRLCNPLGSISRLDLTQESTEEIPVTTLFAVPVVKLPFTEKIPLYNSWIFLNRNQKVDKDEPVSPRIKYDRNGIEIKIGSDSDEESNDNSNEAKHKFSEGEERCEIRMEKYQEHNKGPGSEAKDKSLNSALNSFDRLFCRRCLIFGCRLHDNSQNLIIPKENKSYECEPEENRKPCSKQCYQIIRDAQHNYHGMSSTANKKERESISLFDKSDAALSVKSEIRNPDSRKLFQSAPIGVTGKSKAVKHGHATKEQGQYSGQTSYANKTINISSDSDSDSEDLTRRVDGHDLGEFSHHSQIRRAQDEEYSRFTSQPFRGSIPSNIDIERGPENKYLNLSQAQPSHEWTIIEIDLYKKGLEIFGKNSCLIARNMLSGLKTCREVYMSCHGSALLNKSIPIIDLEDSEKSDSNYSLEQGKPKKRKIRRRRVTLGKLKFSRTSRPYIRRITADGKNELYTQYTPCECSEICGKKCPCNLHGICCEKYCGCPKNCTNRFRGCHCGKGQCRTQQCPCFKADRECDPDVCRNCWISCGDGSLGEPQAQGDGYLCDNMKILMKQREKILQGKSDVVDGWGVFIKNSVNKDDFIGEYTGELISHKEADRRGKKYDFMNSTFLFNLNDKYVLDAFRKGNKLKFVNHSSNPNCYAKVMKVGGDHRVGIYAKECIKEGEEIFYDYNFAPDNTPAWARKPEESENVDQPKSYNRVRKVGEGSNINK